MIRNSHKGFSLVELAIVLIIVALLSSGLMITISAQMDAIASSDTQRRLSDARDALFGYAAANGRLPCPAASGAGVTGVESPNGGGNCSNPWDGFLPAITLGLTPTNENGYALDGWGNPIRYAISTYTNAIYCTGSPCFSTPNGLKNIWNGGIAPAPDLRICNTATSISGAGATATCAAGADLATNGVAVIFSQGKNGASAPVSNDELANSNADRLFVSHTPTPPGPDEFDDFVIWLSPNILYNRMIAAGRLP